MDFERRFADLPTGEQVAFLADLWAARGYQTLERNSGVTAIDPANGSRTRIRLGHETGQRTRCQNRDPAGIDVLVSVPGSRSAKDRADQLDARYCGPGDLRSMVLYAVDRDTADQLVSRYFDQPLSMESRSGGSGTADRSPDTAPAERSDSPGTFDVPRPLPESRVIFACSFVIFCLIGAIGLGVTMDGGTGWAGGTRAPDRTLNPRSADAQYPPGISAERVTNLTRLVDRHRATVASRSYHLVIRHNRSRGQLLMNGRWISSRQVVTVGHDRSYYRVTGTLPPTTIGAAPRHVSFVEHRNRSACERRLGPEFDAESQLSTECGVLDNGTGRECFAGLSGDYLLRYLNSSTSAVRVIESEHAPRYRIRATGTPAQVDADVSGYSAVAELSPSGMVWRLRVEYIWHRYDGPRRVRFEFRYMDPETDPP